MAYVFDGVLPDYNFLFNTENNNDTDCINWGMDFKTGIPLVRGGKPVIVTEDEAVKVWCWFALKTLRNGFLAFDGEYGSDIENIVVNNNKTSEMEKKLKADVRRCLLNCKYILSVDDVQITYEAGSSTLKIDAWITTVYSPVTAFKIETEELTIYM